MTENENQILEEFKLLKADLNTWGEQIDSYLIKSLLKEMIENQSIKISPKFRIKDDKSYLNKALYRKKVYPNPIINIEDKIGTRIIVLKSDDILIAQNLILQSDYWDSKMAKSLDQGISDQPKMFDYQSVHITVQPKSDNQNFNADSIPKLTCEIQIRTLLQHAFAEVSHDSTYKGPYKNDKEIIRRLAKSMALMEATDDYFCNIFEMMSDQKRTYSQYSNELERLFKEFQPKFDKIDIVLTDTIFELLEYDFISIQEIETYVERNKTKIKKYIREPNGLLFQQPVILLILTFLNKDRFTFSQNWPLDQDLLNHIFFVTNTSSGNY